MKILTFVSNILLFALPGRGNRNSGNLKVALKTQLVFVSTLLLLLSCSKQNIDDNDKKQSLEKYVICSQVASEWLTKLDSTNYNHISSLKTHKQSFEEVTSYVNEVQKVYGKINSRKLWGSHIWSGRKLLTYAPDLEQKYLDYINAVRSEDGFYIIKPRYFGLTSYRQGLSVFPRGEIVMLMYQSSPTNKSYAEELVTLWQNRKGTWQVVGYKISDNI
jgi:hypothetical protein